MWALNPAGVAALLSLWPGSPPPSTPSSFATGLLHCPVLLLLQRHVEASVVAAGRALAAVVPPGQPYVVMRRVVAQLAAAERRATAQAQLMLAAAPGGGAERFAQHAPAGAEQERREVAWAEAAFGALQPQLRRLQAAAVRVMDLLVDAGLRINVYRGGRAGRAGRKGSAPSKLLGGGPARATPGKLLGAQLSRGLTQAGAQARGKPPALP